jgi:hypothetical protein
MVDSPLLPLNLKFISTTLDTQTARHPYIFLRINNKTLSGPLEASHQLLSTKSQRNCASGHQPHPRVLHCLHCRGSGGNLRDHPRHDRRAPGRQLSGFQGLPDAHAIVKQMSTKIKARENRAPQLQVGSVGDDKAAAFLHKPCSII